MTIGDNHFPDNKMENKMQLNEKMYITIETYCRGIKFLANVLIKIPCSASQKSVISCNLLSTEKRENLFYCQTFNFRESKYQHEA